MKRLILLLMAAMLCFGAALAQETDSPFFHSRGWNAEAVDLSGVQEVDGRLVGVIKLPETDLYGLPSAELRVDCSLPVDFTPEQKVMLHIERKAISTEELLDALGDVAKPLELRAYHSGVETLVTYSAEAEIDNAYFAPRLSDASLSPAFTSEEKQAKEAVRTLINRLGGEVAESVFHANRRDAAHADHYSRTQYSGAAEASEKRRAKFEQMETENGRTTSVFTMVRGLYELYGLPVMDQFYYPKEDDWIGAASEFRAAVRDDGAIRFVEITGLPQVTCAEPMELAAFDWQTLLKQAVANLCATNACPEDEQLEDAVLYAGYSVITDLKPCWVGLTADTLVPGWYCVTEQRVAKDGSLAAVFGLYGDHQTLMQP